MVRAICIVLLLAVGCARDNPLFGFDGANTSETEGSASSSGPTDGVSTDDDGTEAGSSGHVDSGAMSGSGSDGGPVSCPKDMSEVVHIYADADMFVDSRPRCDGGDCADRNFGITSMRPVGAMGEGEVVYVMRFDPGVVVDASAIADVDLLIPIASETPQPTQGKLYPVALPFVEGGGNGALGTNASTWNHAIAPDDRWLSPSGDIGDFGVFEADARENGSLREFPLSASLFDSDDPDLLRLPFPPQDSLALAVALADGVPVQVAFATGDFTAAWQVLALESRLAEAELRLRLCLE